jgi:putative membrane protein
MTTALTLASHGHGWFPWFPLIPLLFFGVVFTVFVVSGRRWRRGYGGRSGEAVLGERYARGEIDEAEFRARRRVLRAKD